MKNNWLLTAGCAVFSFVAPVVGSSALAQGSPQTMQHAFLVQNSGWMEPFYADPQSQLKPLVAAVAQAVAGPQDKVVTLAFSQTSGKNQSPKLLSQAQGAGKVAGDLAGLGVARKGDGGASAALADTDFKEAVLGTITGPFAQSPGILWIFTNNKNSPNNDAQTRERNRDFYNLLHTEPSISKTLAFPLRMPVKGKLFEAQGLMVYALAYGEPAAKALDQIMAQGRLSQVLTKPPARLKPVDADAVRIVPKAVKDAPFMQASLGADKRTVVLDVNAEKFTPKVSLQASLQNLFFPYVIESAQVAGSVQSPAGRNALTVVPAQVSNLLPSQELPVEVSFTLPIAQVPSAWSAQALSAMGKQVLIPMNVELGLSGQRLALSPEFQAEMQTLFPGDPISEVFIPPADIRTSRAQVPLLLRVQYPMAPVIAAVGGGLLLLAGFLALGFLGGRSKRFNVVVDDIQRAVVMKPFSKLVLKNQDGQEAGAISRGFSAPKVDRVVDGHSLIVKAK